MNINEYIKELENLSLSNSDILKLLHGQIKIITYTDLTNIKDIDELLNPFDAVVILYLTSQNYGHWVLLFKQKPKLLSFFDSYGKFPDEELKFVPQYFRKVSKQDYPHLVSLLFKAMSEKKYNVEFNEYQYQQNGSDFKTCGRHVVTRYLFKHLDNQQYHDFITSSKCYTPDNLVSLMTNYISKN